MGHPESDKSSARTAEPILCTFSNMTRSRVIEASGCDFPVSFRCTSMVRFCQAINSSGRGMSVNFGFSSSWPHVRALSESAWLQPLVKPGHGAAPLLCHLLGQHPRTVEGAPDALAERMPSCDSSLRSKNLAKNGTQPTYL